MYNVVPIILGQLQSRKGRFHISSGGQSFSVSIYFVPCAWLCSMYPINYVPCAVRMVHPLTAAWQYVSYFVRWTIGY